jgi:predicted peroxiredoxin
LGNEAKFHVTQDGIFVYLESVAEKGRHLGFLASGELKSASVCVKDDDSKFGAKLLVSGT